MILSKKDRTRREIATQAFVLFEENGYDNVTVAQIVEAAGVSHMTFFRNFPTRASVITSAIDMPLVARLIAAAPLHLGPIECACWALLMFFRTVRNGESSLSQRLLTIIGESEALGADVFGSNSALMLKSAEAMQGRGVGEWESRIISSSVLGGLGGAVFEWVRFDSKYDTLVLSDTVVEALLPDRTTRGRVYDALNDRLGLQNP